jgi:flagellar biosynthetic protein FlhB
MADQYGDKTHEATPYRRQKAREQGQVPRSHDLASALLLLASLAALYYLGDGAVEFFGALAERQLGGTAWIEADPQFVVRHWNAVFYGAARVLLPLMGLVVLAAVAVNVGQVGLLWLPKKLAPDVGNISPLRGFRRIFSMSSAVRLAFGVFKVLVVFGVAAWCLWSEREAMLELVSLELREAAAHIVSLLVWTGLKVAAALVVLAILDYVFQRWKYEQDLRMTSQEVREEMKTLQGDPQILARRRAVQRQLVMQRIRSSVPKADVVVTNPTELAVAIRYEYETMEAPIVVAKGAGTVAQHIRRLALENGIPIVEKKELAQFLYKNVDVGRAIPPERYAAVAEILRYVYQLKGKKIPSVAA